MTNHHADPPSDDLPFGHDGRTFIVGHPLDDSRAEFLEVRGRDQWRPLETAHLGPDRHPEDALVDGTVLLDVDPADIAPGPFRAAGTVCARMAISGPAVDETALVGAGWPARARAGESLPAMRTPAGPPCVNEA